jgi:chromosome partitioning protein
MKNKPAQFLSILVANVKGGVGKTTTVVNLAAAFGALGYRVVVVDCCQQGNASEWLLGPQREAPDPAARTLLDVFDGTATLAALVRPTVAKGVDIVPATPRLFAAEKVLGTQVGPERVLARAVAELPAGRWDLLIIDSGPSLGLLNISAMVAAHELLVPITLDGLGLKGLDRLMAVTRDVRQNLSHDLRVTGLLPCRYSRRTILCDEVDHHLRQHKFYGPLMFKTVIRESDRLHRAFDARLPITLYGPGSIGAKDYRKLAVELDAKWRKNQGKKKP